MQVQNSTAATTTATARNTTGAQGATGSQSTSGSENTSGSQSTTGSKTPVKTTDAKQQMDYMKLIVAQMRNLNPMDPNSGGDGLTTMMQAESLNQLAQLNQALKDQQTLTQTGYASSLLGHTVTGMNEAGTEVNGTVQSITMDGSGPVLELSGGSRLRLLDISKVTTA